MNTFIKNIDKLALALLSIPLLVAMTACTGEMNVTDKKDTLASRETTHGVDSILMPDSNPSVGDGGIYWQQNNCASCHGVTGKGVGGMCDLDLTDVEVMRGRKPIEQYQAIAYGHGVITKMPVLSEEGKVENMEPQVVREFNHPEFASKLDKRIIWDLVFYSRSLSSPLLSTAEHQKMTAVFGANCAVCHGTKGAGDGPLNKGLVLQPAPANFNQFNRFYDRTDEQLWDHIANGIKWEGMPNFLGKEDKKNKVKFDAEYIWKLVQYVRNFHEMSDFELERAGKAPANPATGTEVSPEASSNSDGGTESSATEGAEPGAAKDAKLKEEAETGKVETPEAAKPGDTLPADSKEK